MPDGKLCQIQKLLAAAQPTPPPDFTAAGSDDERFKPKSKIVKDMW